MANKDPIDRWLGTKNRIKISPTAYQIINQPEVTYFISNATRNQCVSRARCNLCNKFLSYGNVLSHIRKVHGVEF